MSGNSWLKFLRHYGARTRNDNMYDETIQRSARRSGIAPIDFEHPMQSRILECFNSQITVPVSVVLTGTAGDGKTHLCRQVWVALGGKTEDWGSDNPYLTLERPYPGKQKRMKVHFIRDLSGWAPQQGAEWRMLLARLPCRKSQEASLANLLGFYLAIWLMRLPFLPSILFSYFRKGVFVKHGQF